jgi:hypothetical protein
VASWFYDCAIKKGTFMMDSERALALGRYVIHLQLRISTVSAILDAVKSKYPEGLEGVPWNDFENQLLRNSGTGLIASEQLRALQSAIGPQTPDSALIKKLHEQFLQEI